jgi:signal transduction histidine kinase/ligand-binding sensor domain-containing protein
MKTVLAFVTICTVSLLLGATPVLALNPSLDISQYAHTAWTVRDGFSLGNIYAMAQTPDGYLWFGTESGLVRFDGVRRGSWQPPAGQQLPGKGAYSLLVTRDGTLWIGTFHGLATWDGAKLTRYPELDGLFVTSMLEDREGTVWAGTLGGSLGTPTGRLCAIRRGSAQCYAEGGAFGSFVWGLSEDSSGALWAGAESGLWRWKPGPPKRYPMPQMRISDLTKGDDGRLLIAVNGSGLKQFAGDKVASYPIRGVTQPNTLLRDHDVDSNKLLRDRNGGLWIGTVQRGLIHVHDGRADVFTKSDGLSGNIVMSLFEDREGNIWVATTEGIDRFGELPVTTISAKQGLSSDVVNAVVAGADGSIWVATQDGLTRWKDGQTTIFRKASGLPDDLVQSLYQDDRGRVWAFTGRGLAYFRDDRFVAVHGVPSTEVYSITGDKAGNLWLSGNRGLSHLLDGHLVEHFPWSALRRREQAKVLVAAQGGLWLSFWSDGGVEYFKDGQVRASYTAADGLGKGHVPGLLLESDGALWASTEEGGLSRIKDGHIATITTRNGLPCNTIHWSIEDNDRSLWLYAACGLVRIARAELDAWIADPARRIEMKVWDAADGVILHSVAPSSFGPPFAKSIDGKLWLLIGEGIEVVDPGHLAFNTLPPPVHIEQIIADHKIYWQNLPDAAAASVRLPARTRDLQIDYTALSLTAPEKVHFKYKLEGQDSDWREVINDREVQYSNLPPGSYRFRVIACNNSGVWNEQGDMLEFSVAPAYYQTDWFRAVCAVLVLALVWAIYQIRVRQLRHDFALTLEARVQERTSVARDLHDTLLQSFHGLMLRFALVSQLLPERPVEAKEQLDGTIDRAAKAIAEGRDAVQGLRTSTVETNDLARAVNSLGEELAANPANQAAPVFRVTVEGEPRDLHPILRDEIYRIAAEALRNAFIHAAARQVEVEIRYDNQQFRLRVRDDGKGVDPGVLSAHGREGHFGLPGMQERGKLIGGKLVIWSEAGAGTEVELCIPAAAAYATAAKRSWISELLAKK